MFHKRVRMRRFLSSMPKYAVNACNSPSHKVQPVHVTPDPVVQFSAREGVEGLQRASKHAAFEGGLWEEVRFTYNLPDQPASLTTKTIQVSTEACLQGN
jgi:hypothetical protein